MFEIYLYINQIDEKIYVGQTHRGVDRREKEHIRDAEKGVIKCRLYYAMRKYGSPMFAMFVISRAKYQEEANRLESFWIGYLGTTNPKIGYNMTSGGISVVLVSEESRNKKSKALKLFHSDPKNHPQFRQDVSTEKILSLFKSGKSRIEIAEQLGIKKSLVYFRLRKAGVDTRNYTTEYDGRIEELYLAGHTSPEIAEILGVARATVASGLKRKKTPTRTSGSRPLWTMPPHGDTKRCNSCGLDVLLSDFGKDPNRWDGLTYNCKSCRNKKNKQYKRNRKKQLKESPKMDSAPVSC